MRPGARRWCRGGSGPRGRSSAASRSPGSPPARLPRVIRSTVSMNGAESPRWAASRNGLSPGSTVQTPTRSAPKSATDWSRMSAKTCARSAFPLTSETSWRSAAWPSLSAVRAGMATPSGRRSRGAVAGASASRSPVGAAEFGGLMAPATPVVSPLARPQPRDTVSRPSGPHDDTSPAGRVTMAQRYYGGIRPPTRDGCADGTVAPVGLAGPPLAGAAERARGGSRGPGLYLGSRLSGCSRRSCAGSRSASPSRRR